MMVEYVLTFFFLLAVSVALFLLYDRYLRPQPRKESELYVEALCDLLDGREETAFTKLRQVVAEDSSNVDAYLRLGQILRSNKRADRALQVHKDLTLRSDLTVDQKVEILQQLYADYVDLKDYDMAQAALKELITLRPRDHWSYFKLLEIQRDAQRWDEAYETAVMLMKIEGNKSKKPLAAFKHHMGEDLYKKREYHKARILFKEALGFDPTFVPAYLAIGDSYMEENRYEDAVNFWNKLITAVPDQAHQAIGRLKKALFTLGRFGEINDICEDILKHSPKNIAARLCLAEFYEKKGDADSAEGLLLGIVDDYPEDVKSLTELLRIYVEKRDLKKIEALIRTIEERRSKKQTGGQNRMINTSMIGI
ncbi:MAG TPA: tetratricopeptide repeat protein [candidate division Zixibacteria bacterium]|nr:tetratricopeptide repeat protein [candidate division Zixibacteria bacterium]